MYQRNRPYPQQAPAAQAPQYSAPAYVPGAAAPTPQNSPSIAAPAPVPVPAQQYTAQPPAQAVTPAPQDYQKNAGQPPVSQTSDFISMKLFKVNGKDKVVDFSSKLTKAFDDDFANIHGCGGSGHAPNSTIAVTLCDFTNGKGEKAVNVSCNIDVEDMEILYEAAMAARLGQLGSAPTANHTDQLLAACEQVRQIMRGWIKANQATPDDWVSAGKLLSNALATVQAPTNTQDAAPQFVYERLKNNSYSTTLNKKGQELAPISTIGISYYPDRRYPWMIQISNFKAPINRQASGATTYNGKDAVDKKEAFIALSADDFCASMVAVRRFVRLWEQRMFKTLDRKCNQFEQQLAEKRQK